MLLPPVFARLRFVEVLHRLRVLQFGRKPLDLGRIEGRVVAERRPRRVAVHRHIAAERAASGARCDFGDARRHAAGHLICERIGSEPAPLRGRAKEENDVVERERTVFVGLKSPTPISYIRVFRLDRHTDAVLVVEPQLDPCARHVTRKSGQVLRREGKFLFRLGGCFGRFAVNVLASGGIPFRVIPLAGRDLSRFGKAIGANAGVFFTLFLGTAFRLLVAVANRARIPVAPPLFRVARAGRGFPIRYRPVARIGLRTARSGVRERSGGRLDRVGYFGLIVGRERLERFAKLLFIRW